MTARWAMIAGLVLWVLGILLFVLGPSLIALIVLAGGGVLAVVAILRGGADDPFDAKKRPQP